MTIVRRRCLSSLWRDFSFWSMSDMNSGYCSKCGTKEDSCRVLNKVITRSSQGLRRISSLSSAFFCSIASAARSWYISESRWCYRVRKNSTVCAGRMLATGILIKGYFGFILWLKQNEARLGVERDRSLSRLITEYAQLAQISLCGACFLLAKPNQLALDLVSSVSWCASRYSWRFSSSTSSQHLNFSSSWVLCSVLNNRVRMLGNSCSRRVSSRFLWLLRKASLFVRAPGSSYMTFSMKPARFWRLLAVVWFVATRKIC